MSVAALRRAGRPRDPRLHEAILRATAELLGESGYAKLSIDGVAQRAFVTRQSIYRRWPTKLYRLYSRNLLTPGGPIIPALVAESLHDAELVAIIDGYTSERRTFAMQTFERAIARGEMSGAFDPQLLIDMVSGFFWYRKLLRQRPIRAAQAEQFVDIILRGIS
jgi:AcrR family transcriptional regulator